MVTGWLTMSGMSDSPGRDLAIWMSPIIATQGLEYYAVPHEVGYGSPFAPLCLFGFLLAGIALLVIEGPALSQKLRLMLAERDNDLS